MSNPSNNNNNNNNVSNPIVGENCTVTKDDITKKLRITRGENMGGYYECTDDTNDTISSQRNSSVKLIYRNTEKTKAIITYRKNKLNKRRNSSSSDTIRNLFIPLLQNGFVEEVANGRYREVQVNEEGNIVSRGDEIVGEQTTPPTQNNQGNGGGSSNNGAGGNNNNAGGGGDAEEEDDGAEEEDAEEVIGVPDLDDPEYYNKLLSSNQARGDSIEEQYKEEQKIAKMKAGERFNELDTKSANAVACKLEHECNLKIEEEREWISDKVEEYNQENNKLQNCNKTLQDTIDDDKMDTEEKDGLTTMLEKRKTSLIQSKRDIKEEVDQVRDDIENELKCKWSEQKKRLQIGETPQGAKRKFGETLESIKLWITLGDDEEEEEEEEEEENENEQFEQFDNTEAAVY